MGPCGGVRVAEALPRRHARLGVADCPALRGGQSDSARGPALLALN